MILPSRIVSIGIRIMVRPRLEVIHIDNMPTRGRGKVIPNLIIYSLMIMGTTSVISLRWGT